MLVSDFGLIRYRTVDSKYLVTLGSTALFSPLAASDSAVVFTVKNRSWRRKRGELKAYLLLANWMGLVTKLEYFVVI
jgi:hypothetical protein